jgi:thiol:disulfide interchange protein
MVTVRKVFGLILFGMALYFLLPLLHERSVPVLVAFFAISAAYLIAWEARRTKPKQFAWALRGIGGLAALTAVFFVVPRPAAAEIEWQPYSEEAVTKAVSEGKGVIIDTFADWCIPCRELDHNTFTDASVKREANHFVMLKLNLTSSDANTEAGRAATRYDIRGVPTVLFIDGAGHEIPELRLVSFAKPSEFLDKMMKLDATLASTEGGKSSPAAVSGEQSYGSLPSESVTLLDGGKLDFPAEHGKVVLIDFWATWCVPCAKEFPIFNALAKDYKDKGLEVIGVAMDQEGASKVKPFLKTHPMSYRVALGSDSTAKSFGVGEVYPVTIIADKQGRIRYTHSGITEGETFRREIEQLLKE